MSSKPAPKPGANDNTSATDGITITVRDPDGNVKQETSA